MWVIPIPLSIPVSSKKKFSLNLNIYRNAHHMTLNRAKREYTVVVKKLLKLYGVPSLQRIHLVFTLYPATRALVDTSNVCCIVEKFFNDALVESGLLPDDNFNYLVATDYRYGSVDSKNPRVEVKIIPLGDRNIGDCMKLILTNEDLLVALRNHIDNNGVIQIAEDADIDFEILEDGDVEVIITPEGNGKPATEKAPTATKTTRRTRRTKAQIEADEAAAKKAEVKAEEPVAKPVEAEKVETKESAPTAAETPDLSGATSLFDDVPASKDKLVEIPQDKVSEIDTTDPVVPASELFLDH